MDFSIVIFLSSCESHCAINVFICKNKHDKSYESIVFFLQVPLLVFDESQPAILKVLRVLNVRGFIVYLTLTQTSRALQILSLYSNIF